LLAVATPKERLIFTFFVCTGLRTAEVRNAEWSQVDFTRRVFTVRQSKRYRTKSRKARYVPLPDHLLEQLKVHKLSATCELIFPTSKGKPDLNLYEKFVGLAERAGVPCNGVHQLRRTFATQLAQDGADTTTIRDLLGHSNIATTERYLAGLKAGSEEALAQSNRTFAQYGEISTSLPSGANLSRLAPKIFASRVAVTIFVAMSMMESVPSCAFAVHNSCPLGETSKPCAFGFGRCP
jgi:hypothetical protein